MPNVLFRWVLNSFGCYFLSSALNFVMKPFPFYFVSPGFSGTQGICVQQPLKNKGFGVTAGAVWLRVSPETAVPLGNVFSAPTSLALEEKMCSAHAVSKLLPAQLKTGIMKAQGLKIKVQHRSQLRHGTSFYCCGVSKGAFILPVPTWPSAASHNHGERIDISNSWNADQASSWW